MSAAAWWIGRAKKSPLANNRPRHRMSLHPTAIIDPRAKVHATCEVGPYCVIGAEVELGEGCRLLSHVAIEGPTKIGAHNRFFPFSSIGMAPQDLSYAGEPTRLEMGDHNEIREFVTISRGTVKGGGLTRLGSHILIMAYTHIAHDCVIGDHVLMANAATLGGHVVVEDWAQVGALCKIHHAYKVLLASRLNTTQALEKLKSEADGGEDVDLLVRFIEQSERGVIK